MNHGTGVYLTRMARLEKQFSSLYRQASNSFGMADCTAWMLYFLHVAGKPLTQQELVERMMFPKQTIHSAVERLLAAGEITLDAIPNTRNCKNILLTDTGRARVLSSVARLREAEERAVKKMGRDKMEQYLSIQEELLDGIRAEFAAEGLVDGKDGEAAK